MPSSVGSSSARADAVRGKRAALALACALACAANGACGGVVAREQPAPARPVPSRSAPLALDYGLTFDAGLKTLAARVCFRGAPPPELVCGTRGGSRFLTSAWIDTPAGRRALPVREGRIPLAELGAGGCIHYALDLERAASGWGVDAARRGNALAVNLALILWRPARYQEIPELGAEISLPPGMRALVPWTQRPVSVGEAVPGRRVRYALDASALAFYGFGVFGRFDVESIAAPGVELQAAVLDGLSDATRAHVRPWLEAAARTAALSIGKVARSRVLVVLLPVPGFREPVRFGMAARGGGSSLLLIVADNAELDALVRDWIAVHEFSHFMHPFVEREDAWLSEGLATYYQEVVRVRAGLQSQAEAWRRLYEGSQRSIGATTSLERESAEMFENHSYSRVYWAGAAFALLADAELRERTQGRRSLDDVMRGLTECCAQNAKPMPARVVIAEMDRIAGVPVFSELMRRHVQGPTPPDLGPLFARLGISTGPDGVKLSEAEQAAIRDAIMRGPGERGGLSARAK